MRRWTPIGVAVIAMLLLGITALDDVHGLSLVVRAADLHGVLRRLADLDTVPVRERFVGVPDRDARIRARVYAPLGTPRHTVLLVSGLHPAGIDEPRLVALARRLAEANITVVTPEIPELSRFEITPILTDRIEDAAAWLAAESGLAPTGRIGLMGISFSGGLAVVAAGRPSLRNRLLYVFSFGGHDDLRRVLEYFCSGVEPEADPYDGPGLGVTQATRPPHDYGVAVACSTSLNTWYRRTRSRRSATPYAVFSGPRISIESTNRRPQGSMRHCTISRERCRTPQPRCSDM